MAIPDYQTLMLPLLQITRDGNDHVVSNIVDVLADLFSLTEDERKEMLQSGAQTKFRNRIAWARSYLVKAGLLIGSGRGVVRITERGLNVLATPPSKIDNNFLMQYPEFQEFRQRPHEQNNTNEGTAILEQADTPEELLDDSYQNLRQALADELLQKVKACSPSFFERLVVDLLVAMGYGGSLNDAGQAIGRSGDEGIDGIIKEDRLGLDVIYIQAKRWENTVGRPVIQAFAGSLEGQRAKKGIMITTSDFTKEAKDYVGRIEKKIVLINGEQLANLMMDFNVGVTTINTYVVKKIDGDYFEYV